MKVLVTGGAGFIGSHIVDKLLESSYQVIIVDNLSTGREENLNQSAKFYKSDLRSRQDLQDIFALERPDYVVHHAAQIDVQASLSNPVFDAETNIVGTINLLTCCADYQVRKITYASSAAVYGNPQYLPVDEQHSIQPMSYYGISKHVPEHYIRVFAKLHGFGYTILRYANVYGERQDPKGEAGVISIFIDKLLENVAPFIYGAGEQTRDFIYVKDVAAANLAALDCQENEVFNVSTNTETSVNELFSLLSNLLGKEIGPVYKDPRPGDIENSYLDNEKIRRVLGWRPQYDLFSGLEQTVARLT